MFRKRQKVVYEKHDLDLDLDLVSSQAYQEGSFDEFDDEHDQAARTMQRAHRL